MVAVALKFTPVGPASVGIDVLGIGGVAACKTLYENIKSDNTPRDTEEYLKNTPYLATEWKVPKNAKPCSLQEGAYRSAYSGLADSSPAADGGDRHTTCQFANDVRDQYVAVGGLPPVDDPAAIPNDRTISAFSEWAFDSGHGDGGWLRMACWGGYPVTCQGGIDGTALVFLV